MFSKEEISIFFEELEEKIQIISDNLLCLEKEGSSPEIIQEIFRAAHTIKGSSAVMGYEKMSSLTHEIENIFDLLRQGNLDVTEALIDTLFEALDTLRLLKDEVASQQREISDILWLIEKLRTCVSVGAGSALGKAAGRVCSPTRRETAKRFMTGDSCGEQGEKSYGRGREFELDDIEESVVREAEVRGYQVYWLDIEIEPDCQMKAARAFLIFETLQQAGEIMKSVPQVEDLESGLYDHGFGILYFTREDAGEIKNLVLSIAEVTDVQVRPVKLSSAVAAGSSGEADLPGFAAKEEAGSGGRRQENAKTVRVDVQKLDTLMNLVGELVIDRTRLDRFAGIFKDRYGDEMAENILEISSHFGQVTTNLQEEIMKARMLPISFIFNRFPRMVRDLAHKMKKEVDFIIEGRETELDRNVIEVIGDPLIHLLRNAIDHGIESPEERVRLGKPKAGKVLLKAAYTEGNIVIILFDDGRGMDPGVMRRKAVEKGLLDAGAAARITDQEALNMIFTSGFSTSTRVSSISGRGVGMDIVRNQIEQINGTVELSSVPGMGTTFTIKLPLTLAIIRALMVGLGEQVYAFPLGNVVETLAVKTADLKRVGQKEVIMVRGSVLPLVRLSTLFHKHSSPREQIFVVVLGAGDKKVGVSVDRLIGEQEIVIKNLGSYLGQVKYLSGATILGDGSVALIVDVRAVIKGGSGGEEVFTAAV